MGKVTQIKKTTIKRQKKIPNGYHKCPNCGGDGICKTIAKSKGKT